METSTQGKLFRQAALNRLASPEQLDRLVTVTDAHSWVARLAIVCVLLFMMVWSVFGSIPIHIKTQGIILGLSGRSIDSGKGELQVLMYISARQRKILHSGQVMRIEPLTVKKQQHVTLIGDVRQVSELPAADQYRAPILRNEEQPYVAYLDLAKDAKIDSGYRWLSGDGPPFKFVSGTPINVEIIVVEQRPIGLLIPFLRKIVDIAR